MSEYSTIPCCCGGDTEPPPPPAVCCPCRNAQSSYLLSWTGSAIYSPGSCACAISLGYGWPVFANLLNQTVTRSSISKILTWSNTGICNLNQQAHTNPSGQQVIADFDEFNNCSILSSFATFRPTVNFLILPPLGSGCVVNGQPVPPRSYWEVTVSVASEVGSTLLRFRKDGYDCIPGNMPLYEVIGPTSGNCKEVSGAVVGSYSINIGTVSIT